MEIRKYEDIEGVVAIQDIVEGRMVLFTSHSEDYDFGSRTDLKGAKLPSSSDEALRSKYVAGFPVDNSKLPIYQPYPAFDWALRQGGFDQAANSPFTAKVYLTHPGNMVGQTIQSGALALAFAGGTYTVPSGAFVYSASMDVDTFLSVNYSGADAGKLQHSATDVGIAVVDSVSNESLTFRTRKP